MSQAPFINLDGDLFPSQQAVIHAQNRSFRYGDGLFETMRMVNGKIYWEENHFERLFTGLAKLHFELPVHFTQKMISEEVARLSRKNGHDACARIRLTLFRGQGGLFDPENLKPHFLIESWEMQQQETPLNINGLDIDVFLHGRKASDEYSNLKTNNGLLYAMAAIFAKEKRLNDAIVLNNSERICESSIANIFIIRNRTVFTPPLSEACVAGVCRKEIIAFMKQQGKPVTEQPIPVEDLWLADEIFLTNAIRGIRWVKSVGTHVCHQQEIAELAQIFHKENLFCA